MPWRQAPSPPPQLPPPPPLPHPPKGRKKRNSMYTCTSMQEVSGTNNSLVSNCSQTAGQATNCTCWHSSVTKVTFKKTHKTMWHIADLIQKQPSKAANKWLCVWGFTTQQPKHSVLHLIKAKCLVTNGPSDMAVGLITMDHHTLTQTSTDAYTDYCCSCPAGFRPCEICSSQHLTSWYVFPIHFPLPCSCSLFLLSFCLIGPFACIFSKSSSTSTITRTWNVTTCMVTNWSQKRKCHQHGDPRSSCWGRKKKQKTAKNLP